MAREFLRVARFSRRPVSRGYGHQGEDIRPGNCVLNNAEADRCVPYQHDIAAVEDDGIRCMPGDSGATSLSTTYIMSLRHPAHEFEMLDADGIANGREASEAILGKVADWGDYENGTSYHIHFNIQVFTSVGWVWVNPYMTLVAAYERLIGGRGREIRPASRRRPSPTSRPSCTRPRRRPPTPRPRLRPKPSTPSSRNRASCGHIAGTAGAKPKDDEQ